jgi:hypothetical protein
MAMLGGELGEEHVVQPVLVAFPEQVPQNARAVPEVALPIRKVSHENESARRPGERPRRR